MQLIDIIAMPANIVASNASIATDEPIAKSATKSFRRLSNRYILFLNILSLLIILSFFYIAKI